MDEDTMRAEYDFSNAEKNPYYKLLKRPVTLRLEETTIKYFKNMAQESGIPYQTLINLFLAQCAAEHRKLEVHWR